MERIENTLTKNKMHNIGIFPWDLDFFCGFKSNLLKSNIIRSNTKTEIIFDLQTVDINDYLIELENGYLTVSVTLKPNTHKNRTLFFKENGEEQNELARCIYVGIIEKENISTELKNGILKIIMNKAKDGSNIAIGENSVLD